MAFLTTADSFRLVKEGDLDFTYAIVPSSPRVISIPISAESPWARDWVRRMAHAALEYARQNGLTVVAICPLVKEYVDSHTEYQSLVTTSVA